MGQPLVSVIIPVFNGEKDVALAIRSVQNQSYRNLEILCIDDGSTDRSGEIVQEIASKDDRVRYYYKQNGGVASARNYGMDQATGDYIAFLDQDDVWFHVVSEELVDSVSNNHCDVVSFSGCVGDYCMTRINLEPNKGCVMRQPIEAFPMRHHSSYWFRRGFLVDNQIYTDRRGGIDARFRNEDTRFMIQCRAFAQSVQCVEHPLFIYRNNDQSVVHTAKNGEKVLRSSIDGFISLAENTSSEKVKSDCLFFTSRYFLELLETIAFEKKADEKAHSLYETYHIDDLFQEGFVSDYSRVQYELWKNDPKKFWRMKRKNRFIMRVRGTAGRIPLLKKLYHKKKYPIKLSDYPYHVDCSKREVV